MHNEDPNETHGFNLLVREHVTDETGDFGVGLVPCAAGSFGADLLGEAIVFLEQPSFEHRDFSGDAARRFEVGRVEQAFGVVFHVPAVSIEALDPLRTSSTVGRNGEVNHTVLFTPGASWYRNHKLTAEEALNTIHTTEFVHNSFYCAQIQLFIFHLYLFHCQSFQLIVAVYVSLLETCTKTRVVIARKHRYFNAFWL